MCPLYPKLIKVCKYLVPNELRDSEAPKIAMDLGKKNKFISEKLSAIGIKNSFSRLQYINAKAILIVYQRSAELNFKQASEPA